MALPEIIEALDDHWDEVVTHLRPGDIALIAAALERMTAASGDVAAAGSDIVQILAERLPPGNVVGELISKDLRLVVRGTANATAQAALPGALRILQRIQGLQVMSDPGPDERAADDWLLGVPALTEQQVRDRGGDPSRDDLIRLTTSQGRVILPTFQFGQGGQPVATVTTINRLLAVSEDPWGVADWWLGRNAWLGEVPAKLLGQVDDGLLLRAARAELPEG